jgi:hypothetical protein
MADASDKEHSAQEKSMVEQYDHLYILHNESKRLTFDCGRIEAAQSTPYFDPIEERRLCRKIDLYILPTVCLLFLACVIDRANIGVAIFCLQHDRDILTLLLPKATLAWPDLRKIWA